MTSGALALAYSCATSNYNVHAGMEHPPFDGPVLVYEQQVANEVDYRVIGQFVEESDGYGETEQLVPRVMWKAAQRGANGILIRSQGKRVSFWSWAAPYVEGDLLWISNREATASSVDPAALLSTLDWLYRHKLISEAEYLRRKALVQSHGATAPGSNDAH